VKNYEGKHIWNCLPEKYRWTPHNLVGHPLSEILYLMGSQRWSRWVHDVTLPFHRLGAPGPRG
jgi:hypothetical protein